MLKGNLDNLPTPRRGEAYLERSISEVQAGLNVPWRH